MPQHEDSFESDVLASVFNHSNDVELQVIADQCVREVRSGANLNDTLTQAAYQLGLSVDDVKRVEAMVEEQGLGMDKFAGLKSTLKQLRRQLDKYDAEDIDGMNKLLSAIKGVEDQLKQKDDKREQRKKKKRDESKPKEADEPKETEASVDVVADDAAPKPKEDSTPGGPDPLGNTQDAPLPNNPETQTQMLQDEVDLLEASKRVESKIAEIKGALEQAEGVPELRAKVEQARPMLMAWLQTLEESTLLVQRGAEKYQLLLSKSSTRTDAGGIIKRFVELAAKALKDGEEWGGKALQVMKGLLGSSSYQSETKPSLRVGPTPSTKQKLPHQPLPPKAQASMRRKADELSELGHTLDALKQSLEEFDNWLDVASHESSGPEQGLV